MNPRSTPLRPLLITLAAGMCAVIAPDALGQGYAGGDGRVLERDLRVGAGRAGLTPRASMAEEVRLRNALITGNVGGLRSFHGNVGYTAPDDFRASLGSDSTFAFRRDSTSASQFSRPLRGGEGLRYQFYTATGMATRKFDDEVDRLGATGAAAAQAAPGTSGQAPAKSSQSLTQRLGAIRSTAAYDASRDLTPTIVGYSQSAGQYVPVTASALLGLRNADRAPLTTRYAVPDRKDEKKERPGLQQNLSTPLAPLDTAPVVENLQKSIIEPVTRTLYQDLRERIKKQEDEASSRRTPAAPDTKKPEDANPSQTTQPDDKLPAQSDAPATPNESDSDRRLRELRDRLMPRDKNGSRPDGLQPNKDGDKPLTGFDEETVDLIRRAGGQTGAFIDAPQGAALDPYAQHMTKGQDLLSRNKFFDAEEQFARALDQKPGDVTAMAARMHAQLGAGLYLSAAINIRQLFIQAPEVIAMRYSGPTIPPAQRLASVAADLRNNITRAKDAGVSPSVGDSLLLAYVGWQTADLATVDDALTQAQKSAEASGKPEPLVVLLRKAWLEAPAFPTPTPIPAPTPPEGVTPK